MKEEILNVAKCNLGKVKIEESAGQQCPHGRDMWGRQLHFAGGPEFLQLTCLCQTEFISHFVHFAGTIISQRLQSPLSWSGMYGLLSFPVTLVWLGGSGA